MTDKDDGPLSEPHLVPSGSFYLHFIHLSLLDFILSLQFLKIIVHT